MRINQSQYTIAEILEMFKKKDIVINKSYQRGAGLWPDTAQTYFIDTILEGFPFPKLYFYQSFDRDKRKPIKEVVDGQQRLTTIKNFSEGKFKLSSASENFNGLYFDDLSEDMQEKFLMYSVPVDMILAAEKPILLEMFRRMNAYTSPLNSAEKRHSEFQGEFKWFITDIADKYSPIFEDYGILTSKQIIRMGDAELLAEFSILIEEGVTSKSATSLKKIYHRFNDIFPNKNKHKKIISDFFNTLKIEFAELRESFIMKPYVIHSLFTAMTHLKYGIPGGDQALGVDPIGHYFISADTAIEKLLSLAEAHETQDLEGEYKEYVAACLSTTTKKAQRTVRSKYIVNALIAE
ncbi:MAG: DUF262 domain-containing protein [Chloroflexi bacterium]|nr:MAG: DUF262 domain-containing protein [Chloroflexota bacterium]